MNNICADGNLVNNSGIGDKFNNRFDDVYVSETVIGERSIKEEPRDTENKQRSIHNYDLTVVTQKTELMTNWLDDELCTYEILVSDGCLKQEPCDTEEKLESIHVNMKDGNIGDRTVVAQETELITDCIDDKICKYETLISGGYVKQDPCDMEGETGSIHNYTDMKDEMTNTKGDYVIYCKECDEAYDLYCLKCPMLVRIFNSDNTLPKKILDLCETASGADIVALRPIPKGVVFGPFKDLDSTKDDTVSKKKMRNGEVANRKDPKGLNWMRYIRKADRSSHPNLTPFRYEDELYCRSDCHISMGDELLVRCDSDNKENGIRDVEESFWEPQVCESLDDTYACTLCCVGYKSISHLNAHNSVCCEKRNKKDFCEEIVRCDFCKIYMDEKEYSEYHMDRCYKSNNHVDAKSIKCDSCNIRFRNRRLFVRHKKEVHAMVDKTYSCPKCKYRTPFQHAYRRHLERVHDDSKLFPCTICHYTAKNNAVLKRHIATHDSEKFIACTLCPYKTTRNSTLKRHIATHYDDRPLACALCPYKTTRNSSLKRHMSTHYDDRPFACTLCSYTAKIKQALYKHMVTHNDDKLFACTLCSYKGNKRSNLNQHMAIHNNDRPFPCTLCTYKATTKSILKQHLATHNDDRSFACTICPYTASKKIALKRHIAAHNEDKSFACTLCSFKTKTNKQLKRHIASHSDDRPFACILCPYKAKRNAHLKRHIVSHNDDKRFACTICPYKGKWKENLKQHLATHNDDRSFACTICPYKGSTDYALKRHIAIHKDDNKPSACTLSPYKAKTKLSVERHIATPNDDRPSIKSDD